MNTTRTPKISVVTPLHNAEKYITQTIESILSQTFKNFEFIIVDDGSTDKSLSIVKRYALKDRRIKILSRANTGESRARNDGVEMAKGEYIAVMDNDDVSLPYRLEKQVSYLDKNNDVVCVGGAFNFIDEKGRMLTTIHLPLDHEKIDKMHLKGIIAINHPASLLRKKSLFLIGGYNVELDPSDDLDLFLKLAEIGRLHNLEDVVLSYRLHNKALSITAGYEVREKAYLACKYAWIRRNINEDFEYKSLRSEESIYEFELRCGWWAFSSKNTTTAIIYGLKAIKSAPLRREGWHLLFVTIAKRIFHLRLL